MTWYELLNYTRNGGAIVGHTNNGLVADHGTIIYLRPERFEKAPKKQDGDCTMIRIG